jgi:hypothetical protein
MMMMRIKAKRGVEVTVRDEEGEGARVISDQKAKNS